MAKAESRVDLAGNEEKDSSNGIDNEKDSKNGHAAASPVEGVQENPLDEVREKLMKQEQRRSQIKKDLAGLVDDLANSKLKEELAGLASDLAKRRQDVDGLKNDLADIVEQAKGRGIVVAQKKRSLN